MNQIQTQPYVNQGIRRNAIIFGVLTIIIHIIACFMFGFFFRLPAQNSQGVFAPLFVTFAHGVFVIIGTCALMQASDCSSPTQEK